ncbi:restriction endonuclease subunit S [Chromohalobacter sp. 296-RDG]|uniref:restriction endonuclease subunit S n=1 Tax=Chromohalobacter sp. 296-RDG TaxID=2994062 RepID=UPI00246858A6|nr:restriction endonuclease subunit S [Chromohalobacter sp. 296-RDG]
MTALNDICELIVDCEHKTAPKSPAGFPSIRTPNVGRGRLILDNVNRVDEETYALWTRRAVPKESDLIIAREAPVGNVAIIRKGEKVCLGQRTVLVRPDPNTVNPEFLCYFMLGDYAQVQFGASATGATVLHLNMRDIRGLQIPTLPTRKVQNRIASILSAYDDLIENNTRRIEILEEMARRLYEEWFVHFRFPGHEEVSFKESELGKIPEGWECAKLKEYIELSYGKALKNSERKPGPYPVYGASGEVGTHIESLVKGPGIILGRKGNVGSVFWTESDFFPIDTVYYIKTDLPLEYVFFNLKRQRFLNNDAAVPGLNRNQAYSLPFLKPSQEALEKFTSHCKPIYEFIRKLHRKNSNLRTQRDLLLPKLVSGEIDVSDIPMPNDTEVEAA